MTSVYKMFRFQFVACCSVLLYASILVFCTTALRANTSCDFPKNICCDFPKNITTFIPRSQGANTARELVGWQRQLFQCYNENYAALAVTTAYDRSFDDCCIAQKLFGTSRLTFAGSNWPNRQDTDLIADYFGLATDFHGTLIVKPRIENVVIDINLYFGLQEIFPGFYIRIHAPIAHTRWTLGLDDCLSCADKFIGSPQFPQCYMSFHPPASNQCPVNPTLNGLYLAEEDINVNCTTHSLKQALSGNFTFGDMQERWTSGRFDFCPRSKTGLADIDLIIGENFVQTDFSHFGLFALVVIPTGNRPKGRFIFEPIVGNGKHWQAGGGLNFHYFLFNMNRGFNVGLYVDSQITHVFDTDQRRSFDFAPNGLLSRYMLLKEFNTDDQYCNPTTGAYNTGECDGGLINAINFATRNAVVKVGLQADVSAKLTFVVNNWDLDLGYNFFFRDCEKICIKTECPCAIDQRRFGFKGLENVCCSSYPIAQVGNELAIFPQGVEFPVGAQAPAGCAPLPDNNMSNFTPLPNNATQPNATAFVATRNPSGQPGECDVCITSPSGVPEFNQANFPNGINITDLDRDGFYIYNNVEPQIITCRNLDPHSAEQGRMMTHKFFGHLSYTFSQSCYCPHIGVGGEIEFDGECHNALQQWGIWFKGGLTF